jgi:hypothetical protein
MWQRANISTLICREWLATSLTPVHSLDVQYQYASEPEPFASHKGPNMFIGRGPRKTLNVQHFNMVARVWTV